MPDKTDNHNIWICRERRLSLCAPLIMGVLNVTPDSFYDGGCYYDMESALARAHEMVRQGADIIDIGGESSRPGASEVMLKEEFKRVLPVVQRVAEECDVAVSVDTRHISVAEGALNAGAHIINNIMPLDESEGMACLAAEHGTGIVLMHMRGSPETMCLFAEYDDVVNDVRQRLRECVDYALKNGVAKKQIVVDPGIGFAKKTMHNLELLAYLDKLRVIAPVLVGTSRKRFIGEICNSPNAEGRMGGSIGAALMSVLNGASVIRVHDVKETRQALAVALAIRKIGN